MGRFTLYAVTCLVCGCHDEVFVPVGKEPEDIVRKVPCSACRVTHAYVLDTYLNVATGPGEGRA